SGRQVRLLSDEILRLGERLGADDEDGPHWPRTVP
ncbi:MAG: hypothetical protein JWP23_1270, partial [Phenylobacterium sp.]|nr:hypothetical protein [Phenylobacterium sp.]MDB5462881.1 hypothetical protein [Phenylobacterium sp.]